MNPNTTTDLQRPILVPLLAVIVLASVGAVAWLMPLPVSKLTRDVAALGHVHPLTGVLSTLGILVWCGCTAVCLFTVRLLGGATDGSVRRYLLSAGSLTAWLLFDDAFQFHERLAPALGLRERYVYVALAVAVVSHLAAFRSVIVRTEWPLLSLALALLGLSAMLDTLFGPLTRQTLGEWQFFVEDGAKWLGIVCWAQYHIRACACAEALAGNGNAARWRRVPGGLTPNQPTS